jgi:hypothetical protein
MRTVFNSIWLAHSQLIVECRAGINFPLAGAIDY